MDVIEHLKTVTNLNQYMHVSQYVASNFTSSKIELNMSTIQALKKTKSFEIEYFNKHEESGAAIKMFELILLNSPSETWDLLGKELVFLVQYWLNALRKHLIIHNNHWWPFLQTILKFIKELGLKESKLNDMLVKETSECLLDLATHTKPDLNQRHKILCCLNSCGVACSRETRIALRNQFDVYFIKLATFISSCGDVALQYSIMETLLRWLLPRYVQAVRRDAAAKWFPNHLYDKEVVTMFIERPWRDFFQDTRDFLNAHNARGDLVTSVICNKLVIGQIVIIAGSEKNHNWLDINTSTRCLSLMLEPRLLKLLGCSLATEACEALVISEANTAAVKLRKEAQEVSVSVRTLEPAHLIPSLVRLAVERCRELRITISAQCDMGKVDSALRRIFADKYQEEDATFSIPIESVTGIRTGYVVKSRTVGSGVLTSTTSTTSLAQLKNELANLPHYEFKPNRINICASPELSRITEVTETDVGKSSGTNTSSFKFKSFGVCQKNTFLQTQKQCEVKKGTKETTKTRVISPAITDEERSVSCLFVATIGSADESVISDTLERFPKSKDNPEDIINVLVQEALQAQNVSREKNIAIDSKLTAREADNISVKPVLRETTKKYSANKIKSCTIISNSTSPEEIVEGTQFCNTGFESRNIRKKLIIKESDMSPVKKFNNAVEEFFSQHIPNKYNNEAVSPSLARKHNETDSQSSEEEPRQEGDLNKNQQWIKDLVEEHVKFILDTKYNEFGVHDENLHETSNAINKEVGFNGKSKAVSDNIDTNEKTDDLDGFKKPKTVNSKSIKNVTLKFKNIKKETQRQGKIKFNNKSPVVKEIETKDNTNKDVYSASDTSNPNIDVNNKKTKRCVRNRRKLYSPKMEAFNDKSGEKNETQEITKDMSRVKTYTNKKSSMTSYREIEKERNEYRKKLRNKQSNAIKEVCLSPKSKKLNDIFDTLKSDIDTNKKVTLADNSTSNNVAIYNFSSESEDDNFKISAVKHRGPKSSIANTKSDHSTKQKTQTKTRNVKPLKSKLTLKKPAAILIDEKMREAPPDTLNTSFTVTRSQRKVVKEEPNITKQHEMDFIEEPEEINRTKTNRRVNTKLDKKKNSPSANKKKGLNKINKSILNETFNITESPLPELLVDTMPRYKKAADVSASSERLQKIKEMYVASPEKFENVNTTQNLLLDLDQTSDCGLVVDDDDQNSADNVQSSRILRSQKKQTPTKKIIIGKKFISHETLKNKSKSKKRAKADPTKYVIDISADSNSERSIKTVGYSPITAHGDFELCHNDLPPSQEILNKTIEPRNLEIEEQNQSIKDLYLQLNTDILEDHQSDHSWRKGFKNNFQNISSEKNAPFEPITKLSSDDFIRWLPSPRESDTSSNHSIAELLPKPSGCASNSSVTRSKKTFIKSENISKNMSRKSQISPIRLFNDEPISKFKSPGTRSSESDVGVEQIRNLFYRKTKQSSNDKTNTKSLHSANRILSHRDSYSSSTKELYSRDSVKEAVKRKSFELHEINKKRKIENIPVHSTGQDSANVSTSNVSQWIEQCVPSTSREGVSYGYEDNVRNILEKLDTTLIEIHHNTDKRFINTFVETQKKFNDLRRLHHEVYEGTIRELNNTYKRLQEMTDDLYEDMKSRMRTVITEDSKQKRAMVKILKEDIQAVIEFNNAKRRSK